MSIIQLEKEKTRYFPDSYDKAVRVNELNEALTVYERLSRGTRIYCTGTYRLNASVWDTLQRLEERNYFDLCFDN